MAADEGGGADARDAAAPYVGLRPFRRDERHLFFGRDRDATVLCDKTLGARLTLFYAQSGLGKSSLLRALAAPQLEAEDCLVVYHDAWTGERPAEALGAAIAAAAKLPGAGGSLVEVARTAAAVSGKTLVLLLDQFEEFLIAHAQDLDPLRAEIGALVRARDADLRVVLALREELLAALDPFRHAVPELYQSTCRLEPLSGAAVRAAIVRPAELAGGSVEPGLVEALIADLRADEPEAAGAARDPAAADAVDLPMLQLVCRELWDGAARAARGGAPVALTEALYRATGGAQAVLDRYVASVMPGARGERLTTARLLRLLAPPSGYKASYTLDDLVASSGLPADAVASAIRRLRGADIVRERMLGRAARYELLHDALIRVLGPWRDEVLRAARVRRWAWRAAAAVAGVALLGAAGAALVEWRDRGQAAREFERNTRGALERLAAMEPAERDRRAESTFNFMTSYVIWQRGDPAGFASLRRLLQDNVAQLPWRYGEAPTPAPGRLPEGWPVVVRYAEGRRLDAAEFQAAWRAHATTMASSWGVPVPMRVEVRADNTLPREDVTVRFGDEPPFVVGPLPAYEDLYVVSGRGLSGAAESFVDLFAEDWRSLPQIENAGPWYAVPRWSLPVWRSSGATVESGSRLPALSVFLALQKKPRPLVTPEAVEILLERAAKIYPRTVAEARAARGERLADDIAELVRLGRELTGLPLILDELADRPGDEPDEVARSVEAALTATRPEPPPVLHGAWPKESERPRDDLDSQLLEAYREAEPWLPKVDDLIRVEIGAALDPLWLRDRSAFHPDFVELRETLRERLFARYGFVLPGIFVRYGVLTSPEAFRIEVLNQTDRDEEAKPIAVAAADSLRRFSDEMAMRGAAFRVRWITAETAAGSVAALDENMRAWIAARHSTTDVKNLLRGAVDEDAEARAGQSLPPEALLLSLPYWRARHGGANAATLSAGLARLRVVTGAPVAATSPGIERGLDFLFADDPDAAEAWFPTARDSARGAADDAAFVAGFQRRWVRHLEERLRARCVAPYERALNQEERVALIRRVAAPDPAATGDDGRRAALCLHAEFGRQDRRARELALLAAIDAHHADLARWPDAEVEWLVRRIVERYDPLADGPQPTGHAARLLTRLAATGDPARHAEVLGNVLAVCRKPGPRNWCWALADGFVAHPRVSPYAALNLAIALGDSELDVDLRRAMAVADGTPARIAASRAWLKPGEPERLATFVPYVHARAASALARYHDDEAADAHARQLFPRVAEMKDRAAEAELLAITLHRGRGRWAEVEATLAAALRAAPRSAPLQHHAMWFALSRGERDAADRALAALDEIAPPRDDYGFTMALAATLIGRDDWEHRLRGVIQQGDQNADYVLMILSAFKAEQLRDEALFQLDRRAAGMTRASWPARLRGGDATAWHEILISYLRGKVPRAEVFAPLADDAAFARSDFAGLRMPRRALLCEAHFYDAMRARMAGDRAGMEAALRATVAVGYRSYLEDAMARYLLARAPAR